MIQKARAELCKCLCTTQKEEYCSHSWFIGFQWLDRLDDALEAAQRASRLDSNNREANMVARKARAVTVSRSKGNELFKTARFSEACVAYGEGLEHDPYNSVLLCNRGACWSKLGQLDKAIEDCTAALNVRPSYSKARLRRADCNAKVTICANTHLSNNKKRKIQVAFGFSLIMLFVIIGMFQ